MSGRRRKGGHGAEFHLDERWMTSYADMITVLMCLFIVLYAMSTVNTHKFDELKNALATGFGHTKTDKIDPVKVLVDPAGVAKNSATTLAAIQQSEQAKQQLAAQVRAALKKAGESSKADVHVSAKGVTIGLVGSSTYFGGNDATIQPEGYKILAALGPTLRAVDKTITIEGHAAPGGSAGMYGSDWTLAGARASNVLAWLLGHNDVAAKRVSSISYGSSRPVKGKNANERNRRVDIVIHAPDPTAATATAAAATPSGKGATTAPAAKSAASGTKEDSSAKQ